MKLKNRTSVLKFLVGIFLASMFTVGVYPHIMGNWSEHAFRTNCSNPISNAPQFSGLQYDAKVKYKVAEAAVYFLSAKSRFDNILQMVEAYGATIELEDAFAAGADREGIRSKMNQCPPTVPNCDKIKNQLSCAIKNLDYAIGIYNYLICYTNPGPNNCPDSNIPTAQYNQDVLRILKIFKYKQFFAAQNPPLSPSVKASIQQNVIDSLKGGDLTGIYSKLKSNSIILKNQLEKLLRYFTTDYLECPNPKDCLSIIKCKESEVIKLFWMVDFDFVYTQLFGQYVSEIFLNIKEQYCCPQPTYWVPFTYTEPNCTGGAEERLYCRPRI